MEGAIDKTYVSKRVMEQYAQERQQRIEQKKQSKTATGLSAAAGKTFTEDQSAASQNSMPSVLPPS